MAEVFVGFDSAWTDNAGAPGAICALVTGNRGSRFLSPRQARFGEALTFIESLETPGDLLLVALDQPTRVPNLTGGRPVERAARSLLSSISTAVQPARRGDGGASMFGDDAPVWPFLAKLSAREHPLEARVASSGRWLIEVFPSLALPSIAPEFWERRRAAKYNPAAPSFDPLDWPRVCLACALYSERLGFAAPAIWLKEAAGVAPNKALQDRLDSLICLLIALAWRRGPADAALVLGDLATGYIVTPAEGEPRARLIAAAERYEIPVDRADGFDGAHPVRNDSSERAAALAPAARPEAPTATSSPEAATVDPHRLRAFLVGRRGAPITYGEIAHAFGHRWTQGFGASLAVALAALGRENRRRAEPQLMALVVNKASGRPGAGFYSAVGLGAADPGAQMDAHGRMCAACRDFDWSEAS